MAPRTTAAFHQAVTIQHRVDGTFGRNLDVGEPAHQALADLTSTPTGVLVFDVQDVVLHLKRELVGIAIGTTTAVGQGFQPTFLVSIDDLISGFAGDPELPAQLRHGLASESARHEFKSFIHDRTLLPRHPLPLKKGESVTYVSGTNCYLCVGPVTFLLLQRNSSMRFNFPVGN